MNKGLITLFIILTVVVLVIVLMFGVFVVRKFEVWSGEEFEFSEEKIITDSKIKKGTSIFAVSEQIAIENIEKTNPYIKVVNIEKKSPNKVIIHIAERFAIIAIPIKSSQNVLILDRELKVLAIEERSKVNFERICLVEGYEPPIDGSMEDIIGTFLDTATNKHFGKLKNIYDGYEANDIVNFKFSALIKRIDLTDTAKTYLYTSDNVSIEIQGTGLISEQIAGSYKLYLSLSASNKVNAKIVNDGTKWKVVY